VRIKESGIYAPENRRMGTREIDRPLQADALREIERAVRGKLRAFDLSDSFIERCLEDSIQKGLVEYLRKLDGGEVIENRNGFVVRAAFLRAIDELRREARQADGEVVGLLIESGRVAEPPSEELAIEYLQAEELREAVRQLSPEEQQVLSLHYFEEKTAEASAEALFCSERTYRRRLKQALRKLGRMLDAPVPEPGSQLAIEIGVFTWVGLRGAKVAISQGPFEHLFRLAEGTVGRIGGSETTERVATIAGSGPAKVVGGCTAACLLAVGGAQLAGVGGPDQPDLRGRAQLERAEPSVIVAPPVPPPPPAPISPSRQSAGSGAEGISASASAAERRKREANREVESQGTGALFPEERSSEPTESTPVQSSPPPSAEATPNRAAESQGVGGLVGQ
jgi:RNA polymerase sigma factor (sigma-70 family)